jgi:hypothetical protein
VLATVGIRIGAQHAGVQDKVIYNVTWLSQGISMALGRAEEEG